MATKTINVQYQLRGDSLENLTSVNPVLGLNEPVVVRVPGGSIDGLANDAVLLKVGDGTTAFNDLEYIVTVPTASAGGSTEGGSTTVVQGDSAEYSIQAGEDGHTIVLVKKGADDDDWTEVATVTVTDADTVFDATELKEAIAALEDSKADKADTLAGYGITDAMTAVEIQTAIKEAIIDGYIPSFVEASEVPDASTAEDGVFYLVSNDDSGDYDIWAKVGDSMLKIGDTQIDLRGYVKEVKTADGELEITSNRLTIPTATLTSLGLVKSSDEENGVYVDTDGTMSVNSINVNKLVQTEGDTLILSGGAAE